MVNAVKQVIGFLTWNFVLLTSSKRKCQGMQVALAHASALSDEVLAQIDSALLLMEQFDPLGFARLRRCLKCVVVLQTGGPAFIPPIRGCILGESLVLSSTSTGLALMLVHEAAHARLWQLGFRYGSTIRSRIERFCIRCEIAFASRLPESDTTVPWVRQKLTHDELWTDESLRKRRQIQLADLDLPVWLRRVLGS